jgi:hypothetical protein
MAAMAFSHNILSEFGKLYDLFKIWKLGHTHTYHENNVDLLLVDMLLSSGKKES